MSHFVSEAVFGNRCLFVLGLLKVDFHSSPDVFGFISLNNTPCQAAVLLFC